MKNSPFFTIVKNKMLLCEAVPGGRQPHSFYMSNLKQTHFFNLACLSKRFAEGYYFLFSRIEVSLVSKHYLCNLRKETKSMTSMQRMTDEQLRIIFAASCIEAAARRKGISATEMYRRMARIGMIEEYILPYYDLLHTQSREYITDTTLETLHNWEIAGKTMKGDKL